MRRRPDSVRFVVTRNFEVDAKIHLSEVEFEAIKLLLAVNPAAGTDHPGFPGVLTLQWRVDDLQIWYTVQLNEEVIEIILVTLVTTKDLAGQSDTKVRERIKVTLKKLTGFGVGMGIREIWSWIKEHFSEWF